LLFKNIPIDEASPVPDNLLSLQG